MKKLVLVKIHSAIFITVIDDTVRSEIYCLFLCYYILDLVKPVPM